MKMLLSAASSTTTTGHVTPEGVLQAVKEWRLSNGLPGFKNQ
ncbi:hypothetical protein HP532_16740 [Pseudomonas sp. CrR25]|nr:hypothetical protein [Pseudomonas sp. CrR25]